MKVRYGMAATLVLTLSLGLLNAAPRREIKGGGVPFDYVPNSSLIVLPVMINKHGPYKLLLDTGTTRTILSAKVADKLGLPKGRIEMLFSTGGNSPVRNVGPGESLRQNYGDRRHDGALQDRVARQLRRGEDVPGNTRVSAGLPGYGHGAHDTRPELAAGI